MSFEAIDRLGAPRGHNIPTDVRPPPVEPSRHVTTKASPKLSAEAFRAASVQPFVDSWTVPLDM